MDDFGHPEQDRAISLREAACLQTFPEDYEFFGDKNPIARWIGNAVPVSLGEAMGRAALTAAAGGTANRLEPAARTGLDRYNQ